MKRARGIYILASTLLFLVLILSSITAAINSTNVSSGSFEKSYTCLSNLVDSKLDDDLTNEELSF